VAELTKKNWWRFLLWVAIGMICIWVTRRIYHTLIIFGLALLITYLLNSIVTPLSRWRIPIIKRRLSRGASIVLVYVMLIFILSVGCLVTIPLIVDQANNLLQDVPNYLERIQKISAEYEEKLSSLKIPPNIEESIRESVNKGLAFSGEMLGNLFRQIGEMFLALFSWLFFIITAVIISIFMLVTLDDIKKGATRAIPAFLRRDVETLLDEMNHIFGGYLKSIIILCATDGLIVLALLSSLGIFSTLGLHAFVPYRYSLVVSILAAITYPVPVVGIIISSGVAGLLAYLQSPSLGYVITVVLIIIVVMNAVDRILGPKIMSETMGVSPLFVMFAAFAGAELLGLWGMLLGVPIAAMLKAIFLFIHKKFLQFPPDEGAPEESPDPVTP
jgi:predicted PurR-regulated permease PerM